MARLVAGSSLEVCVGSLCTIHGDAIVNMRLGERGLESTARGSPNKKQQDEDVHGHDQVASPQQKKYNPRLFGDCQSPLFAAKADCAVRSQLPNISCRAASAVELLIKLKQT